MAAPAPAHETDDTHYTRRVLRQHFGRLQKQMLPFTLVHFSCEAARTFLDVLTGGALFWGGERFWLIPCGARSAAPATREVAALLFRMDDNYEGGGL